MKRQYRQFVFPLLIILCYKETGLAQPEENNSSSNSRKLLQSTCEDILPPEALFKSCQDIAVFGLCESIQEGYCEKSCKVCQDDILTVCEDIPVIGTTACPKPASEAFCNSPIVAGRFCQMSCGNCTGELQRYYYSFTCNTLTTQVLNTQAYLGNKDTRALVVKYQLKILINLSVNSQQERNSRS
eukprot:TRINITY_DN22894_c0_g1_i4.p1 TRINITY_DN22894_c0_g1~~TRINITY_DN22894_c0_g1_i4.p1  ORF type:complete len:185 (-),score=3.23 TRINITY_DN22894_c0_g1_i4:1-555(-)